MFQAEEVTKNKVINIAIQSRIYRRFYTDDMVFAITMICNHNHWQTYRRHTGTNILTHTYKYILTPPVMCAPQLPVLHWINNFVTQNFSSKRSTMPLLFKNYSLVEVIHQLVGFNKTKSFLWNIKKTDGNGINGQNMHTPHTERKITLGRVS